MIAQQSALRQCSKCSRPALEGRKRCETCAAYQKNWAARNKAAGLCGCGKPVTEGRTACAACLESMRRWVNNRRAIRQANGLCVDCGNKSELNQARCIACGSKKRKGLPQPIRAGLRELRQQEALTRAQNLRDFILNRLDILDNARSQEILRHRYSPRRLTLEDCGKKLGISRERVRQLQEKAENQIFANLITVSKSLQGLDQQAEEMRTIGCSPATEVLRSPSTKEYYQYWYRPS